MQINVKQVETSAKDAKVYVEFYKLGRESAEKAGGAR